MVETLTVEHLTFIERILGRKLQRYEVKALRGLLEDKHKKSKVITPKNQEVRGRSANYIIIEEFPLDISKPLK